MTDPTRRAVIALGLCALADFAAAPALMGASGADGPMRFLAIAVLGLGILTVIAAVGLARGRSWAAPLAVVTRVIDVVGALPGIGAGLGPAAAVVAVLVLSVVAVVFVLRSRRAPLAV